MTNLRDLLVDLVTETMKRQTENGGVSLDSAETEEIVDEYLKYIIERLGGVKI